eukprot:2283189-Pyramimonas_sp.AAC.1
MASSGSSAVLAPTPTDGVRGHPAHPQPVPAQSARPEAGGQPVRDTAWRQHRECQDCLHMHKVWSLGAAMASSQTAASLRGGRNEGPGGLAESQEG